jgi:hypothetical protein
MVVASKCPDRSQMERYLRAELSDEEASAHEDHFEKCNLCAKSIHELSSEDSLMKALGGGESDWSDPAEREVDALAEEFCHLLPGLIAPMGWEETTDLGPDSRASTDPSGRGRLAGSGRIASRSRSGRGAWGSSSAPRTRS